MLSSFTESGLQLPSLVRLAPRGDIRFLWLDIMHATTLGQVLL